MPRTQTEREKMRADHPDSWIPVIPGDTIAGEVVDVTDAWSDQRRDPVTNRPGSPYPLLTMALEEASGYEDPDNGSLPNELKVHCFGAILFNEIMRKQPAVGERIRITYGGVGKAKEGQNAPELYRVRAAANTDVARRAYDAIGTRPGTHPEASAASKHRTGETEPEQPELPAGQEDDDIPF